MSYLVFARKYRPATFEDVVAQEHVTRTLKNALVNDRVGSGYLFCGPRGTGKTTVARILAKSINCVEGPTPTPCCKCVTCTEITSGSSLDVLEIDAASNTGVDDIRTLRENVRYLPTSGKKRIYIIDEVHRLSGSAFDALLKTLEEPPEHVIFMFATTEPLKIPETILSRTQRFDFRRVSVDDLAGHLGKIAKAEKIKVEDGALHLLARKADGSVRDALSLLDQIAAFSSGAISEQDVVNALGLVDRGFLFDFVTAIAEADRAKALQLTKQLFDSGVDVKDFVIELLEHLRVLMVLTSTKEATDLLNLQEAELKHYKEQAASFSIGDILRLMKTMSDLNRDLGSGLHERLLLEVAAVKMATMESTVRFEELLAKIGNGPPTGSTTTVSNSSPDIFSGSQKKNEVTASSPRRLTIPHPPERPAPTRSVNIAQLKAGWSNFLTFMRSRSRMLSSQLNMAEVRSLDGNQLLIVFPGSADSSLELVSKKENKNQIETALLDHFKAQLVIKFDLDQEMVDKVESDDKKDDKIDTAKLIESSEGLKKIIELVDGEVIGVRKQK